VSTPEEALAEARAAAARMRADGHYADAARVPGAPSSRVPRAKLFGWAVIEPDTAMVRSTRRAGAPITLVKRLLLRLLVQYHVQLLAEQNRFNVMLLRYVSELEERIAALEQRLGDADSGRR
jgi:hypothetical protein